MGNAAARTSDAPSEIAGNHLRGTSVGAGKATTSTRRAIKVPWFRLVLSSAASTLFVAYHEMP